MPDIKKSFDNKQYSFSQVFQWFVFSAVGTKYNKKDTVEKFYIDLTQYWNMSFERYVYERTALAYILFHNNAPGLGITERPGFKSVPVPNTSVKCPEYWLTDLKAKKTYIEYSTQLELRLTDIVKFPLKLTREYFIQVLGSIGYFLWLNKPQDAEVKSMQAYLAKLKKFEQRTETAQFWFNIAGAIAMIPALLPVPLLGEVIEKIGDKVKDEAADLLSIDKISEILVDIGTETLKDEMTGTKNDIIKALERLDDKTRLELSPLINAVNQSSNNLIRDITKILNEGSKDLVKSMTETMKEINKNLNEARTGEKEITLELNREIGRGFGEELRSILYVKKEIA